jgi:hypothetical protein
MLSSVALPLLFPLRAVRVNAERYVGIREPRNLPTISHQRFTTSDGIFCTQPATEIQSKMSAVKVIKNISG